MSDVALDLEMLSVTGGEKSHHQDIAILVVHVPTELCTGYGRGSSEGCWALVCDWVQDLLPQNIAP
jgi:hypothetical protein